MLYSGPIDGRQVRAARAILGMTLEEIARLAGLNRNSVHRLEHIGALPEFSYAGSRLTAAMEPLGIAFSVQDGNPAVAFTPTCGHQTD